MTDTSNWKASLAEHRTAWIVASLCLLIILTAAIKPDLFEGSLPDSDSQLTAEAVVDNEVVPEPSSPPPPPVETKTATPVEELAPPKKVITPTEPAAEKKAVAAKEAKAAPSPVKSPVSSKVSTPAKGYYVQLGAFSERPRAQGLVDQLKRQGFSAVIVPKSGNLLAVWAGPKKDRTQAERLQQEISAKMKIKGFIVQQKGA